MQRSPEGTTLRRTRLRQHGAHDQLLNSMRGTIPHMVLLELLMRVLEVMFLVGLAGSTVVVLISFFEDGKELFGKD